MQQGLLEARWLAVFLDVLCLAVGCHVATLHAGQSSSVLSMHAKVFCRFVSHPVSGHNLTGAIWKLAHLAPKRNEKACAVIRCLSKMESNACPCGAIRFCKVCTRDSFAVFCGIEVPDFDTAAAVCVKLLSWLWDIWRRLDLCPGVALGVRLSMGIMAKSEVQIPGYVIVSQMAKGASAHLLLGHYPSWRNRVWPCLQTHSRDFWVVPPATYLCTCRGACKDLETIRATMRLLGDESLDACRAAVQCIARIARQGDETVTRHLTDLLGSRCATTRWAALETLSRTTNKGDPAVVACLVPCLEDPDPEIRTSAVDALRRAAS